MCYRSILAMCVFAAWMNVDVTLVTVAKVTPSPWIWKKTNSFNKNSSKRLSINFNTNKVTGIHTLNW